MHIEKYERTEIQKKFIEGMDLVLQRLIEFIIRMKTPMVIMRDDKIVHMDPLEFLKEWEQEKNNLSKDNAT